MNSKNNEIEVSQFITEAISKGLPAETMERLFALYEKASKEKARNDYIIAISNFQSEIPIITKTKIVMNKDGRTVRYKYAPLEEEIEQIKTHLVKNGLAYSWNTLNSENRMTVVCKLTHISGHTEESSFTIPIEESQFMTSPQSYASAQTFAKRYTLNNILGIATSEEDTDATDVKKEKDVKSIKSRIVFLLKTLDYEVDTKEQIEEAIKEKTKLELTEKNFEKIAEILEKMVKELQEDIIVE